MEDKKDMIEQYIQSYNSFDVEGMLKDVHERIEFENISNGKVDLSIKGIEEFRKQAIAAKAYFTHREQKITSWDFKGNVVTIEIDYEGVLAVDFPNGMKTGDTLQLKGQSIFEFEDDKISKIQDKS
ncbi:MAG: nuclear transport factor 2 family protein [Bacteroidota bacterium]